MSCFSSKIQKCNYHCPVCRASGATPNMAGRFFIINDAQCQCNACNSIFKKSAIYAKPVDSSNLDGEWTNPLSVAHTSGTGDHDTSSETTCPESVIQ